MAEAQQSNSEDVDDVKEEMPIPQTINPKVIAEAEKMVGLAFTESERELMLKGVNKRLDNYEQIRSVPVENSVPPAISFSAELPGSNGPEIADPGSFNMSQVPVPELPSDLEDLAFYPVTHLSQLIRTRQVSSMDLTEMYLNRLKRYDDALKCVVTLTEALALTQAKRADEEIANGHYRGPLHGIPWGAKDLLATQNIPTTWGAMPYKDQVIDTDATVVGRLEAAGAVLVAKLTLGALASGDIWFDGQTKSPWDLEQGSSGSSAGPTAAVAGGLVPFAIGSETYGSIVSPCTQCGVTGLRPTFGRISRYGTMALSWSMDKLGPIGRTVEDCALVFDAIHGADGRDGTAVTRPFHWNPDGVSLAGLRIGYVERAFQEEREDKAHDDETLRVMGSMGADLVPIELPDASIDAFNFIFMVEAAAAFDELTRSGRDDLMVRQESGALPNMFREARLIPAVEYIQANRIRTLVMEEMAELLAGIDLYIAPSFAGSNLLLTNMTGHPAVVLPNGFTAEGVPSSSITFMGRLFDEATVLAVAKAYQDETDFHLRRPTMDW